MARLVYLAAAAWLASVSVASADPVTIGVWLAVNLGWQGAISGFGAALVGSLVLGAVGLGAALLAGLVFQGGGTSPDDRQAVIRQSLGPRLRYYGRVKVGGTVGFFENKDGFLYQLITLNWGQISGVVESWLNDEQVTLDGNGYVTEEQYTSEERPRARLLYKDGAASQTAHTALVTAFSPAVDSNFRLRNMANVLAVFEEVKREDISQVYPQLNPTVRTVIDASLCERVRQGDIAWSDNPADVIYDYLVGVDGAGFPWGAGYQKSQINLQSFKDLADVSDQSVPLKAGGSIKRYRLWGGFALTEEVRQVVPRFCLTCDADLYMDTDGKIAIRGGRWVAPQLTLDADKGHIITGEFSHGNGGLAAFNELSISYTEPTLDYQATECEPWVDAANVALRGGVLSEKLDLADVPDPAQARRLGKIYTKKANPEWTGTVVTNFYGLNAIGEETVHIVFPLLGIDADFAIRGLRILDDLTGVELTVASVSSTTYDWDEELEEGDPPGSPPATTTPVSLNPPSDFNVSAAQRDLGGSGTGIFLVATWTEPSRTALEQEVEYRSSPGGTWVQALVSDGVGLAESGLVSSGIDYDVHVRTRSPGGAYGDWSTPVTVTATPNTGTADPVENLSAVGAAGSATIEWDMSPDAWSIGARVYRNTVDDSGTATLIATVYGSPGTPGQHTDQVAAGAYFYWIASWTGSFVEGARTAAGTAVVS